MAAAIYNLDQKPCWSADSLEIFVFWGLGGGDREGLWQPSIQIHETQATWDVCKVHVSFWGVSVTERLGEGRATTLMQSRGSVIQNKERECKRADPNSGPVCSRLAAVFVRRQLHRSPTVVWPRPAANSAPDVWRRHLKPLSAQPTWCGPVHPCTYHRCTKGEAAAQNCYVKLVVSKNGLARMEIPETRLWH